jgi:hypothetical protein
MFINTYYLRFESSKVVVLLTFISIIINTRINNEADKARKFLSYVYFGLIIFFCVCSILDVNFRYSSKTIIEISKITGDFQMWFTHKSRLSSFVVFSLGFVILQNFKNKYLKFCLLIFGFIVILKSHDTTSVVVYTVSIIISYMLLNKNKVKELLKSKLVIPFFGAVVFVGALLLVYVAKTRSIGSITDRIKIWEAVIAFMGKHPLGVGDTNNYSFVARSEVVVHSAHNVFLQEIIESGYFAGFFLILLMITVAVYLYKYNKIYFISFIGTIILANMDITITMEFYNIFFIMLGVIYSDANNMKLLDRNILTEGKL